MESSMNNAFVTKKHETTSDQGGPEESSWTMYFEDFFETSLSTVNVGDCTSSFVSDAMSFVTTKKTLDVYEREGFNSSKKINIKRTRHREIPFGHHHDLEDTASSPSRSPNVHSMMNLLDNHTRHGGGIAGDDTINEKGEGEGPEQNLAGPSVDLKKKGLCLVPLSMVTNYLG